MKLAQPPVFFHNLYKYLSLAQRLLRSFFPSRRSSPYIAAHSLAFCLLIPTTLVG